MTAGQTDEALLARIVWPPDEEAGDEEAGEWLAEMDGCSRVFATEVEALRWALARLLRRADRLAHVANAARDAQRQLRAALLTLEQMG